MIITHKRQIKHMAKCSRLVYLGGRWRRALYHACNSSLNLNFQNKRLLFGKKKKKSHSCPWGFKPRRLNMQTWGMVLVAHRRKNENSHKAKGTLSSRSFLYLPVGPKVSRFSCHHQQTPTRQHNWHGDTIWVFKIHDNLKVKTKA